MKELPLAELEIDEATLCAEFMRELQLLEPFGMGNPEPLLLLRDIKFAHERWMGTEQQHFKAIIGRPALELIAFHFREKAEKWGIGNRFDVLGHLGNNYFRDKVSLQFQAVEIRPVIESNIKQRENLAERAAALEEE